MNTGRITGIFNKCLFKEGEPRAELIFVQGITFNIAFHPGRIDEYADDIHKLLLEVYPDDELNKGRSALDLMHGEGGVPKMTSVEMQELVCLGIAAGWLEILTPRDLWDNFPGSMPIIGLYYERQKVKIRKL